MNEHRSYTLDAMIACVQREIAIRKNVYRGWVTTGRMKVETADHEINCMQAVHDKLEGLKREMPSP